MMLEARRSGLTEILSTVQVLGRFAPGAEVSDLVPLAASLSEREYLILKSFQDGEKIVIEQEPGKAMFFLARGEAAATRQVLGGLAPDEFVAHYNPGDIFGEMAVIFGNSRSATITAKGDVEVYVLTEDGWIFIQEHYPPIGLAIKEIAIYRQQENAAHPGISGQ